LAFIGLAFGVSAAASAASSTSVASSSPTCTGEHLVNVSITNVGQDEVLGYLASGGSSGFVSYPGKTSTVSLSSTSGNISAFLQAYFKTGVPYPQNYHNINFSCKGSYNFSQSCGATAPVASLFIFEPSAGSFVCAIVPGSWK
jgi:hypothetical protein